MSPRTPLDSRHSIESCTFQLQSWRPFHNNNNNNNYMNSPKPYYSSPNTKRPCLSDRTTSFPLDALDMSRLTLFDNNERGSYGRDSLSWFAKKRRRRGSRSVSGRSSDRSGTRRRCCSVGASAAYATCSDFPVAAGTDSSGELFVNGGDWGSDVSEAAAAAAAAARNNARKERDNSGSGEKENNVIVAQCGGFEGLGNESGYGSEPGYRGDAEFGYGDELDEEEEDSRLLFWGQNFGDTDSHMEMVGENTLQKAHHRCRRKKQDMRMVDSYR